MSDLEMVQVGTNINDEPVYNVKRKGGGLVSTTIFTEAEALAMLEAPKETPEVEEAPEVEEEEEEEESEVPDYGSMTKVELEALMRDHGVELDRRLTKSDLLEQVDIYFKETFSN